MGTRKLGPENENLVLGIIDGERFGYTTPNRPPYFYNLALLTEDCQFFIMDISTMKLSERQKLILNSIVDEYVSSALPVSSHLIEKKYNFDISPATIRSEMQRLTEGNYLYQPHTSAGRVPTDKGYRFFVDNILKEESSPNIKKITETLENFCQESDDILKYIRTITKTLSDISSNLVVSYLAEKDFFWKEGWREIFEEPEFNSQDFRDSFIEMIDNFEAKIDKVELEDFSEPRIFIGRENPLSESKDFSLVISACHFPEDKEGLLAILGPKRMDYNKNIALINEIRNMLR